MNDMNNQKSELAVRFQEMEAVLGLSYMQASINYRRASRFLGAMISVSSALTAALAHTATQVAGQSDIQVLDIAILAVLLSGVAVSAGLAGYAKTANRIARAEWLCFGVEL